MPIIWFAPLHQVALLTVASQNHVPQWRRLKVQIELNTVRVQTMAYHLVRASKKQ